MGLKPELKQFILQNEQLIRERRFIEIYRTVPASIVGDFMAALRKAGIMEGVLNFDFDGARLPSVLSYGHFMEWDEKFRATVNSVGLTGSVPDGLHVNFSDEEKTVTYGFRTLDEVKAEIRKKWAMNEEAERILNDLQTLDDVWERQPRSRLAEVLLGCNPNESYDSLREGLEDLFNDLEFQKRILGEYIHARKTIVLYVKNIEAAERKGRSLEQAYEVTFIHELFHAYHYHNDKGEVSCRDYTCKVVKESLASAFEWFYCVENGIPDEEMLSASWYRHSVTVYPYSGARNLVKYRVSGKKYLDQENFRTIFDESLSDMDLALRILLPSSDFYDVKNVTTVRTKIVAVKEDEKRSVKMFDEKVFYEWLISEKALKPNVAKADLARVRRINEVYDLQAAYADDGCAYVLSLFEYSKRDARDGLSPSHDIVIVGDNYTGTNSLKAALKLFIQFMEKNGALAGGLAVSKSTAKELPVATSPIVFAGDLQAFLRYVGPFCKNYVNSITKSVRMLHGGVCEYCGKVAVLDSAHKDGEERPMIIKKILKAHFEESENYYRVDIAEFEKMFKAAHLPVEDHIFFLCKSCHGSYDGKKGAKITTADILKKRKG